MADEAFLVKPANQTQIVKSIQLDTLWTVRLEPEGKDENGYSFVAAELFMRNDGRDDFVILGGIRRDGCANWGRGLPVTLHMCGERDCHIIQIVYTLARRVLRGDELRGPQEIKLFVLPNLLEPAGES